MEFPRGWGGGVQAKKLPWEGCGYFLEQHIMEVAVDPQGDSWVDLQTTLRQRYDEIHCW